MTDNKKTLKFQMMMSPKEAEVLDDWMFENRVRSRAEAIRRLCQVGLSTAEHWRSLQQTIDQAVEANHLAVRVLEEDFLVPAFDVMDRSQTRRYANAVTRAYETLAALSGEKSDFDGDIAPFLDVSVSMDDARRKSEEEREALLERLAARREKRPEG
jgi:phage gp29-like protein